MNEPTIIRPIFAEKHAPNVYQVAFKHPIKRQACWAVVRRSKNIYSTMEMTRQMTAKEMSGITQDGDWTGVDCNVTERGDQLVRVYDNKAFKTIQLDLLLDQTDEISQYCVLKNVPDGVFDALWEVGYGLAHFKKYRKGYQIGVIPHQTPVDPIGFYIDLDNMNFRRQGNPVFRLTGVCESSFCAKEFLGAGDAGTYLSIIKNFLTFNEPENESNKPSDQEAISEPWEPVLHDGWQELNIPKLPDLNHKEIVYFEDTEYFVMVAVDKNNPMVVKLNKEDDSAEFWWSGNSLQDRVQLMHLYNGVKIDSSTPNSLLIAGALREYVSQNDAPSSGKNLPLNKAEIEIILAYRKLKAAEELSKELKARSAEQSNIVAEQHAIINEILMR